MPLETTISSQALLVLCSTVTVLVLGFGVSLLRRYLGKSGVGLPPGPPGHWLFGTRIPQEKVYLQLEQWTEQYGPVYSFRQGLETVVVIGRYQPAVEIMEKHGAILADRPVSVAAGETLGGGLVTLLLRVGERLRRYRRAIHTLLQERAAMKYEPIQLYNSKNVVLDILRDPDHFDAHARRYAASVIMTLTYGKTTPTSYSDPEVQKIILYASRFGMVVQPGAYLVDTFPLLRYMPGYLSHLKDWQREEEDLFRCQVNVIREKIRAGEDIKPCFSKYLLENQLQFGLSDAELHYLTGSMFIAGSDTTVAAISIMIMAAACFPEAQSKVQEELDRIVGFERHPTFADQDSLPQTTAFFLETFRWRPVSATGFAHRTTKDIVWRNYFIPAGATVIGSHWSIFKDPDVFPDPDTFNPQRWIGDDGKVRDDLRFQFNFGFGRRICPGQNIATRSVFINTAMLLWAFRITQDPKQPIDTMAFTETANIHPSPFKANFKPRLDADSKSRLFFIQQSVIP